MELAEYFSLGTIIFLLLLSAFFSGSETALTAASEARIHALSQRGNRSADRVKKLQSDKDRLIGGILLGNNLVNILASALATNLLVQLFGEAGVAYATLAMTLMVLIFAEVLPKTYSIYNSEQIALGVAPVLDLFISIFSPVVRGVQWIVRMTFRLFGLSVSGGIDPSRTEEELRGAIDLHGDSGVEERHEREMLRSILDLGDVSVSEVMTHRKNVTMIKSDQPVRDIISQVLASPYTRIPLWQGEKEEIIGVIHSKALFRAVEDAGGKLDQVDILTVASPPWFIPDTASLLEQLHAFRRRREHFAIVVDEYGALMGIVTLEDILEEIVGEIDDEHDISVPGVRPQSNGSVIVDGAVTIRDLNRQFEWRLPDEDAVTIAGLLMHEAREIPAVGQVFSFHGFRFEVVRRARNQITMLRMTPLQNQQPTGT